MRNRDNRHYATCLTRRNYCHLRLSRVMNKWCTNRVHVVREAAVLLSARTPRLFFRTTVVGDSRCSSTRGNNVAIFRRFVNGHTPVSKTVVLILNTFLQIPGGPRCFGWFRCYPGCGREFDLSRCGKSIALTGYLVTELVLVVRYQSSM